MTTMTETGPGAAMPAQTPQPSQGPRGSQPSQPSRGLRPRRSRRGGLDLYNVIFALLLIAVSIGVVIGLYTLATGYLDATGRQRLVTNIHAAMAKLYQSRPGYGAAGAGAQLGEDVTGVVARYLPANDRNDDGEIISAGGEVMVHENGETYVIVFEDVGSGECADLMSTYANRRMRESGVRSFQVLAPGSRASDNTSARVSAETGPFTVAEVETECAMLDGFAGNGGRGQLAIQRR